MLTSLIAQYGALGVFILMVPESACVPVLSEVTLLFSGFAVHRGWLSLPVAVAAATAGNLTGSLIAYGAGASGQLRRLAFARGVLDRWAGLIERRGSAAVFFARLMPLARTFVSLPAGAQRIPLVPFIALTTAGCALWSLGFVIVGMLAGSTWGAVNSALGRVMLGLGVVLLASYAVRRRSARRRGAASR